ncbi:MAG: PHP domain-containing protein [Candidatus Cloacimonas sp.]|jgi:predicted metal-dependent phosphoesterase TrpH|nr:PHP domain-containing protein [Candidatus Cloacimonas sp.]
MACADYVNREIEIMIVKEIKDIKRINLHLHTNVSDGAYSPASLVKRSQEIGLDLISITDHDTADAYRLLPDNLMPLRILPGMEVSSQHQGHDVHILAYGYDANNAGLIEMTEMYLIGRRERAIKMIAILESMDIHITLDEVAKVSGSRELIVRPHIAQILVSKGYCKTKNEAFDKYIGNFKPAYVPKPELSVSSVLKVIHGAGGLAVIAHPGKLTNPAFLEEFIPMGLDGIEVWHPDHYQWEVDAFINIAQKNGLYMTGGSDFHGETDKHNLFDVVPASEVVLESVTKLWQEYLCRVKSR